MKKIICPYCKQQIEKAEAWASPKGPACEKCARENSPILGKKK